MAGIAWPIDNETQKVSTTSTAKKVWLASLTALTDETIDYHFDLESDLVEKARNLYKKINQTKNKDWRHGYIPLLVEHSLLMASSPSVAAIEMSKRGLDELNSLMTIELKDGQIISAKDAVLLDVVEKSGPTSFENFYLSGSKDSVPMTKFELRAPREKPSDIINPVVTGCDMKDQLHSWADYGCIEPSCETSGSEIADMDDISHIVNDKVFVLLGATSSLGPMSNLMKIKGATIAAIARPGKKIQSLVEKLKKEAAESVTVLFPSRKNLDDENGDIVVGADLIKDAPELAQWITSIFPDKQLVLCCLAYLDGERHVRASVGMDLICEYICEKRKDTALSYLVSPATAHLADKSAIEFALKKKESVPFWHKPFSFLDIGFRNPDVSVISNLPNYRVYNGLSDVQGPNYALAKTAQQWRAMLAHSNGHIVSANHGPPSRTDSMVSHSSVSAALEGMQNFPPLTAFDVAPANSLMTSLMLWDLYAKEKSVAHSYDKLEHPMCLFVENAAHGGLWRCPYDLASLGVFSFLFGKVIESGISPEGTISKKAQ